MSRQAGGLSHHPAPHADEVPIALTAFMLLTGPLAWFAQFCIGVALASWPCFPDRDRRIVPIAGYGWTGMAALILLILCAVVAMTAGLISWRTLRNVSKETKGGHAHLIEAGHDRTRFTALWGTILGAGFSLATLVTLAGFALVPRCAG